MEMTRRQLLELYVTANYGNVLDHLIETVFGDMEPTKRWKVPYLNLTIKAIHE